ncbi:MAG: PPC domain-containing DNA-binding protein [Promethearchaeati archaeon SRVP18_Atabeyarchaeia-1]
MEEGAIRVGLSFLVVCRLDPGQDLLEGIKQVAAKYRVKSGSFSAIGVLSPAKVGYLDKATMTYKAIEFRDRVELVSCSGLVTQKDGEIDVHAHLVVADKDGNAHGGHALDGCRVDVTCELVIYAFDKPVSRKPIPGTSRYILGV